MGKEYILLRLSREWEIGDVAEENKQLLMRVFYMSKMFGCQMIFKKRQKYTDLSKNKQTNK